ncbi:MAG: hypothetical protein EXR72_12700 [Myxococcales bacterium]|nr:hypothetical protein [Myxococcales bacterium]
MKLRFLLPAVLLALPNAGCAGIVCGEGTEAKFNAETGTTTCSGKIAKGFVQCDPETAIIEGGICKADPAKFPRCGEGTTLDLPTNTCIPNASSCGPVLRPCPPKPGKFSIAGVISHLKDGKFAQMEKVEVRAYEPLAFLKGSPQALLATVMTEDATYCFDNLSDPGNGLIAIGVTDPGGVAGAAGPKWFIAGVGQDGVNNAAGKSFRVDANIIERSLVAEWNKQCPKLAPIEMNGGYIARFLDKGRDMESTAKPVAGVKLAQGFGLASDVCYFKKDISTLDPNAMATDADTGAVIQRVSGGLATFGGMGGMIDGKPVTWEKLPGGSFKDVIFVSKFHPQVL